MPMLSERAQDPLARFRDGARITATGAPLPLIETAIDVRVLGALAIVRTERLFRNDEPHSIEATITFPVPVHATLAGLSASIDGRSLVGRAQRARQARETYEAAIDAGRTSVLHEEAIRGVHVLSVGHVPPGKDIAVASTWATPLSRQGGASLLRIPVTVGDIYGRSPLPDSDDLIHAPVVHEARLTVSADAGQPQVRGVTLVNGAARVILDRPIDLLVPDWSPRTLHGVAADGRDVTLDILPLADTDACLDAALLLDQSGSMGEPVVGHRGLPAGSGIRTKHDVMVAGLRRALAALRRGDALSLWQFDAACEPVGSLADLWSPRGGTEIGLALARVAASFAAGDIAVITDGKSHAIDAQALARSGRRFSAVLVGEDSLDARIGHLAALTGGQVFVVPGAEADAAILAAVAAMRQPHVVQAPIQGAPLTATARVGGMEVRARWGGAGREAAIEGDAETARIIGAVAAALAIPRMEEEQAAAFAEAHGIVCHLTSLVLVDEAGEVQDGLPAQRKVPLMAPATEGRVYGFARAMAEPMEAACAPLPRRVLPRSAPAPRLEESADFSIPAFLRRAGNAFVGAGSPPAASGASAPTSLKPFVGRIDWSNADALRRGDTRALPPDMVSSVAAAATVTAVSGLAREMRVNAVAVVIALLAKMAADTDRNAARIFRVVLGKADPAKVEAAMKAVGLGGEH